MFHLQHYLQLCDSATPESNVDSSQSDSGFWTLPRNFRLRTADSDEEDIEEEERSAMVKNNAKSETTGRGKLFRQHTISNPGYSTLLNRLEEPKLKQDVSKHQTLNLKSSPYQSSFKVEKIVKEEDFSETQDFFSSDV